MVSMPTEVKTVSKLAVNLVSRSRTRNRKRRPDVFEVGCEVAGHLGDPGTVGVGGDAEQVHSSSVDLDHEEHVEAAQCDGVDGEEVGGQDAFGLGTEELAPGGARPPRRGREAMAAKNSGDAGLGDGDAELLELTDDAEVAPARVLPCQADDQLDCLFGQGRAAVALMGISPSSSYEGTMPAKDCLGRDEEGCPPLTRDEASEGTDERSVRPGKAGTADLALEYGELVAQHEDLRFLRHRVHPVDANRFKRRTTR